MFRFHCFYVSQRLALLKSFSRKIFCENSNVQENKKQNAASIGRRRHYCGPREVTKNNSTATRWFLNACAPRKGRAHMMLVSCIWKLWKNICTFVCKYLWGISSFNEDFKEAWCVFYSAHLVMWCTRFRFILRLSDCLCSSGTDILPTGFRVSEIDTNWRRFFK